MTRPAPQDSDQRGTRARILAAARELFAEHGYSGASISRIASRADVLVGSIYWAFDSKEMLFAAVLSDAAEDWRAKFGPGPHDRRMTIATVREDIARIASGFAEAPAFLRLLMVVATEHQASSPEILHAAVEVRAMWRNAIEDALAADLTAYDPDQARALVRRISRLVLQLMDGVFMSLQIERTESTAEALVADVAEVIQRELQFGVEQLSRPGEPGRVI